MKKNSFSALIAFSIITALLILLVSVSVSVYIDIPLKADYILLEFFITIVGTFILLYYFSNQFFNKKVQLLNDKIKAAFLSKKVPSKQNLLEEADAFSKLSDQVDLLIAERQLEKSHFENMDSYRREYLGNVSHELKTPIFNIQGYLDTLIHGGLYDEQINLDYLKRAEKSVARLISIIDDLETITQLESGDMPIDKEPFDLVNMCKDIFNQMEIQAAKKNISLVLAKKYDKPILVNADKFRIRQVLVNLISNSIKYGRENGKTELKLSPFNKEIVIEISDNGMGIEETHLPRLFERFYRVDKGRSREQGGTGLGLAIVKHILEAHHKSIVVTSKVGQGTKFKFYLESADN